MEKTTTTTTTTKARNLKPGDQIANPDGSTDTVFEVYPSFSEPGKTSVGAGHDGAVFVRIVNPDTTFEVVAR